MNKQPDDVLATSGCPYKIEGNPRWPILRDRLSGVGSNFREFFLTVQREAEAGQMVPGFLLSQTAWEMFEESKATRVAENELRCHMQRKRVVHLLKEGRCPDDIALDKTECLCSLLRYFLARSAEAPWARDLAPAAAHECAASPEIASNLVSWNVEWQEYLTELLQGS